MNNRFGFRDFVLSVLLVAIIVAIGLHMTQVDRQWERLGSVQQELEELTGNQSQTQSQLDEIANQLQRENASQQTEALTNQLRQLNKALRQLSGSAEGNEQLSEAMQNVGPATQPAGDGSEAGAEQRALAQMEPFDQLKKVKQEPDYAKGDWLVSSFSTMPEKLTPLVSSDVYGDLIHERVLQTLAERDPETLEYRPLVARSWQIEKNIEPWREYVDKRMQDPLTEAEIRKENTFPSDGSDDKKQAYIERRLEEGRTIDRISNEPDCPTPVTIEFEIRRGVTFSDGEPLTADDVVFTYDWLMNPEVNAPRERAYYRRVESVEKLNQYRVAFHFRAPYFQAFPLAADLWILPEHFYSQFTPQEFNTHPGLLMGSGPYRLPDPKAWRPTPGEPIRLVRNKRYWGEAPAFDRLIRKIIEQDVARVTAFLNEDLDTIGPTPKQFEDLTDRQSVMEKNRAFSFYALEDPYMYIGWNQQRNGEPTRFADRKVRQAMTMLINRKRLIEQILRGYGQIVTGPFSPLTDQYDDSIEPWPFSPERARKLLAEAGFEDRDGDGVIESSSGEAFEFELLVPSDSDTFDKISASVKDAMARGGVIVNIKKLPWSVLLERKDNRNFDAISLGWGGSEWLESDPYQIFHSDQIKGSGDNSVHYANPELDRLIEKARRTMDDDKRMQLWHQVHEILHEDQPYTFLYLRQSLALFDKRIKNIYRTELDLSDRFLWYVPGPAQKWGQ